MKVSDSPVSGFWGIVLGRAFSHQHQDLDGLLVRAKHSGLPLWVRNVVMKQERKQSKENSRPPEYGVLCPERWDDLVAYEYLWTQPRASFKRMAKLLVRAGTDARHYLPQAELFDEPEELARIRSLIESRARAASFVSLRDPHYPPALLDALDPLYLFYFRGKLELLSGNLVSVIGTRQLSGRGEQRVRELVGDLGSAGYSIVSGLAKGADTVALRTAIDSGTKVIAVIGTAIDEYYPRENRELQELIAREHLLMSQVPLCRYSVEPFRARRRYFLERNVTMAALSRATLIVEAGDRSGALRQARACIEQGRPLFILDNCLVNADLKWPQSYIAKGARVVERASEIIAELSGL